MKLICIWSVVVVLGVNGCSIPNPPTVGSHAAAAPGEVTSELGATDPTAAEVAEKLVGTGKRQYGRGLLDSAQKTLEKAVHADPKNLKAWYYLNRVNESIYQRDREEQHRRDLLERMTLPPDMAWLGAEPGASPNVGLAEPLDSSGVGDGPPSVS